MLTGAGGAEIVLVLVAALSTLEKVGRVGRAEAGWFGHGYGERWESEKEKLADFEVARGVRRPLFSLRSLRY